MYKFTAPECLVYVPFGLLLLVVCASDVCVTVLLSGGLMVTLSDDSVRLGNVSCAQPLGQ